MTNAKWEPHYGDKVKILTGFYRNMRGTLEQDSDDGNKLIVHLENTAHVDVIEKSNLKLISPANWGGVEP